MQACFAILLLSLSVVFSKHLTGLTREQAMANCNTIYAGKSVNCTEVEEECKTAYGFNLQTDPRCSGRNLPERLAVDRCLYYGGVMGLCKSRNVGECIKYKVDCQNRLPRDPLQPFPTFAEGSYEALDEKMANCILSHDEMDTCKVKLPEAKCIKIKKDCMLRCGVPAAMRTEGTPEPFPSQIMTCFFKGMWKS